MSYAQQRPRIVALATILTLLALALTMSVTSHPVVQAVEEVPSVTDGPTGSNGKAAPLVSPPLNC